MTDFETHSFETNGQTLHVKCLGRKDAPVMVMLHGFPEFWKAWAHVAGILADDYRIVLPDQRGFNLSSKPKDAAAYDTKHMVADLDGLMDQMSPEKPFVLCGHDWGASVAYAYAMRHAERVSQLVIANGVHPICFQKALLAGGPQTDASQYMNVLSADGGAERVSRDNFAPLLGMFEDFSAAPWLDEAKREEYRQAWKQDGALPAMLNWYRGSPMIVPKSGSQPQKLEITQSMRDKYRISMPHLLLWGGTDVALLPEANADLDLFCDDLTRVNIKGGSHWLLHEKPHEVAKNIKHWLA